MLPALVCGGWIKLNENLTSPTLAAMIASKLRQSYAKCMTFKQLRQRRTDTKNSSSGD
jgi:hypothetical protein